MAQPIVTIRRIVLKADCTDGGAPSAATLPASPAKISYNMYPQPAIPITKPTVALMKPASPNYPPTTITIVPIMRRQKTPTAMAVQAARIR